MLKTLHRPGLHVDIDKCIFFTTKAKCFGMTVTTNSIQIDTKKVEAIQKWKTLLLVKNMQAFLVLQIFSIVLYRGVRR